MHQRVLLTIIISSCVLCNDAYSEENYYYGFESHIPISKITNKVALYQNDDAARSKITNFLSQHQLEASWKNSNLCVIDNAAGNHIQNLSLPYSSTTLDDNILYLPVYTISNSIEAVLFHEIIVKIKEDSYETEELIQQYGMTLKKDGEIYQIYSLPTEYDPISVANTIYETGQFEFAYPHFFLAAESFGYIPNDPYFQYQITCHNIGQVFNDGHTGTYDADINAPEAWEITKGSSDIVVAVFDEGVTSNHPDLPNLRQVRLNGSNFGSGDPNDPSPIGNSNHGNACAGVIAATMDNNEGIAGIAPNCKIMPLRWDETSSNTDMADGIKFAVDNGANIISCSWGYGTSNSTFLPAIISAIDYAINNGVIVVFAAGNTAWHSKNNKGIVTFPANANINNLITVGASDRYDKVAEYSPINALIDVVAPSHRAYSSQIAGETFEMWSLDIPGNDGYNPAPEELDNGVILGELLPNSGTNHLAYTGRFGGTSHACPVVAGVVALMLSVNPYLSPNEVFSILTSTCDKVGNYSYINGKSEELGYGRVDAYAAVMAAKTKYLQNQTYLNGNVITERAPIIIAGSSVTNSKPYGDVILEAGSNVTLAATEQVVLKPGFHAKNGCQLHIKIGHANKIISTVALPQRKPSHTPNTADITDYNKDSGSLENIEVLSISVYTISGQLLQRSQGADINLSALPNGFYVVQKYMADGRVESETIAKY